MGTCGLCVPRDVLCEVVPSGSVFIVDADGDIAEVLVDTDKWERAVEGSAVIETTAVAV